jgi:hypothetical protein
MSPGLPAAIDPITVPINAMETVNPSVESVKPKYGLRNSVVPEITAVSNPKRKPPNADTNVAKRRFLFIVKDTFLIFRFIQ